jgi:hypothetical protein
MLAGRLLRNTTPSNTWAKRRPLATGPTWSRPDILERQDRAEAVNIKGWSQYGELAVIGSAIVGQWECIDGIG